MDMCFREKKNKSGMLSIQILDESCGSCLKSKTSVSFSDPEEINLPALAAYIFIPTLTEPDWTAEH